METFPILSVFWISCIILWVFLLAVTLYQTNRSILERKGYSEAYVAYLRQSGLRRNIGIAIVVPLLGVVAGLLVYAVAGDIHTPQHASYVLLVWLLLIIPFPIIDHRQSAKKAKEIVLTTGATVVVDLNYRVLHLVFQPRLEAFLATLYVLYFVIFFGPFHITLIHVGLLWVLYATARFGRHVTPPAMRDAYLFLFAFIMVNQALLLFHLVREMLHWNACCAEEGADLRLILGTFLAIALLLKALVYLLRLPEFNARLKGAQSPSSQPADPNNA